VEERRYWDRMGSFSGYNSSLITSSWNASAPSSGQQPSNLSNLPRR
jgi:hypothetical protein